MKSLEVVESGAGSVTLARKNGTHPVGAYIASLAEGSRAGQFSALASALAAARGDRLGDLPRPEAESYRSAVWSTDWSQLRHEHVAAIRSALAELYKPATTNKVLAALKGVLRAGWNLGQITTDDYMRATNVKPVRGKALPKGRDISLEETALIMRACGSDPKPAGVRDAAMIGVGWHVGLRIAEVASLDLADFDPKTGRLEIREGKGSKAREVWITNESGDALADWLEIRGDADGALFCPITNAGIIEIRKMSTWAIQKRLKRRAAQAGVDSLSWHDLRRTCAGDLIESRGLGHAQKVLGHANPSTTSRYSRRDSKMIRDALTDRHLPYKSRRNGRHA